MFDNIGDNLKGAAYFLCTVGIISSLITGMIIIITEKEVLIGILTIVLGALFSWISSCITYAIGEIAENTAQIRRESSLTYAKLYGTEERSEQHRMTSVFESTATNDSSRQRYCPHCGETVQSSICEMCGKKNDFFL